MTEPAVTPPVSHLMDFILAFLSSLMAGISTDLPLARLAAQEAIAAYQSQGQNELVTIAQILAFALTALDNLRLSMPADLSLSMKLKLRGNANALNRSSRDHTQTPEKGRRSAMPLEASLAEQATMARWDATATAPDAAMETRPIVQKPTPIIAPAAASTEHQNRLHWAGAMKTAAARLQASAAIVSPAQRKANLMWIDALTGVASDLAQGKYPTAAPGMSKADLLRTTLMAGDSGFPNHLSKAGKR
jgi:hypothetical protein